MITGEHFIALAGKLVANPSANEATCRTAVSRAYYGAFHLTRSYLLSLGVRLTHSHGQLPHLLQEAGHARAREAGGYLSDLQSLRVKADYDLSSPAGAKLSTARWSVELAAGIRSILSALESDLERELVKTGVEAYLRKVGQS